MIGPHVFGDGRLGIWNIDPRKLIDRLAGISAFGITDVFLPRNVLDESGRAVYITTADDMKRVRDEGLGAHLWVAPHGRSAKVMAADTVLDVIRLTAGAADLNVELADDADLGPYMRTLIAGIRSQMPSRRLRLNIAWRKGRFLPVDLLLSDPQLFAAEEAYVDAPSMNPTSAADALQDLLDAGVPLAKAAVCYAGAGTVRGVTGVQRIAAVPHGGGWLPRRGVIFSDDLMADAGLI